MEISESIENVSRGSEEDKKKLKDAQSALEALAQSKKDSKISELANIFGGHLALENADAASALKDYQMAQSAMKTSDPFYAVATLGLGYALEKEQKLEEALGHFEKVVALKEPAFLELGLWESARVAHLAGKKEQSLGFVKRLLEEFPSSVYEGPAKT